MGKSYAKKSAGEKSAKLPKKQVKNVQTDKMNKPKKTATNS